MSKDNHSKLFIQLLEEIRLQKNISRYKIAKETGLSEHTIRRTLSHETEPSLPNFLAIAKTLGINFFFESKDSGTDLNKSFQNAMSKIGRNPNDLPKN